MPITAFALENFMAFERTDWLELQKLTLLLGRNSNGKTALIRALRLLKQSVATNNPDQPFRFVMDGGLDAGHFKAVLHQSPQEDFIDEGKVDSEEDRRRIEEARSWSKQLSFSFRSAVPLYKLPVDSLPNDAEIREKHGDYANVEFEALLGYRESLITGRVLPVFWELSYCGVAGERVQPFRLLQLERDLHAKASGGVPQDTWRAKSDFFSQTSSDELADYFSLSCLNGFLPELTEGKLYPQLQSNVVEQKHADGIRELWQLHKQEVIKFLDSIKYVGPIRPSPERFYLITAETREAWRRQGATAFLDYLEGDDDEAHNRQIASWLDKFKLGQALRRSKADVRDFKPLIVSRLELEEANQGAVVNLKDVGYGASQIIPIIVQCLDAPPDALVIIEQPELHLHPSAQADIADLLIESINEPTVKPARQRPLRPGRYPDSRRVEQVEQPPERVARRYLVETHSETLLLRLRVRLAQGPGAKFPLDFKDFNCYFVNRPYGADKSTVKAMEFNEDGEYTERPLGFVDFFSQDFKELLKLKRVRLGEEIDEDDEDSV